MPSRKKTPARRGARATARKPARGGRQSTHPIHETRHPDLLERVRKLCLALPETREKISWGRPVFLVKGKMFVMYLEDHHGDGRIALWCNAHADDRAALLGADGERFFVPPYVGVNGWVGLRLDRRLPWGRVAGVVAEAWRKSAPPKLAAMIDGDDAEAD